MKSSIKSSMKTNERYMNRFLICITLVVSGIFYCSTTFSQEGYPLEGTWQGLWGNSPGERNFLTLVLRWDGREISGEVNPGRYAGTLRQATLDSSTWSVVFDMDITDRRSGETSHVMAQGMLLKLGSPDRIVLGSLTDAGPDSYFKLTRQ